MATKKISELSAGSANANAVVPATNAAGTTTEKITLGAIAALGGGPPAAHKTTHATGGSDALSAADIGAAAASHPHAAADITSGTLDAARLPAATTTASGAVEIATVAETLAGTDTTRSVTPESVGFSRRAGGRAKFWEIFCDFAPDAYGIDSGTDGAILSQHLSGAGAAANVYTNQASSFTTSHAGIITLATGTTTAGYAGLSTWNSRPHRFDTGTTTFEALLRIPTLATAGEDYVLRIGYVPGTGLSNDEMGFEYDRSASANWRYMSGWNGSYTRVDSGKAVEAAKWIKVRFVATHTSASFYVNDASIGTITTNIRPSGGLRIGAHIIKTAGTTSREVLIDYIFARHDFSTDRTYT